MNVLIITEFFPESANAEITGGVESRAFFVAREMAKKHKVSVLTSKRPGTWSADKFKGIDVIRIGPAYPYAQTSHLIRRLLFSFNACLSATVICLGNNITVVDGYSFFTYMSSIFAGLFTKARSVLTYHEVWIGKWMGATSSKRGIIGEFAERVVLLLSKLSGSKYIAVSEFTKLSLVKNGVDPKDVIVVNNGVDLKQYKNVKVKKRMARTICFVGRLVKNKRVEDLVEAFRLVKKKIKRANCIIVGDGTEKAKLEKQAVGIGDIEFTGFLPSHNDVLKILKSSHVFCLPSVVEGFGITLVEAMACGVPFVCSDIPPLKEVSDKGKGGLLFKQRDVDDLASKLIKLLSDKKFYNKCVKEESVLVNRYDWASIARQIEKVYDA